FMSLTAEARDGVVAASFDLTGEGPHAINVQLVSDPARTATVPIVGSRAAERSRTVFSPLGAEVTGSLLPSEGSQPVRGIHLEEGAFRTSPFRLESVAVDRARLTAVTAVETVRIVIVDPTRPRSRPGALDPATARHPSHVDEGYRRSEALFAEGKLGEALSALEAAIAEQATPHPNYAYSIACCHARSGDLARAIAALEAAIRDGWSDFEYIRKDEDLAALRGHPGFEALFEGPREITLDDVAAGQVIELDVPGPMALVALGAWIAGEAWEGWATVITRETIAPCITAPASAEPGRDATILIDTGRAADDASLYVVIKDARLLTPDTPASRLAAGLKAFAEAAGKELVVGAPKETLASSIPASSWPDSSSDRMMYLPRGGSMPSFGGPLPPAPQGFGPPPASAGFGPSDSGFGPPPAPRASIAAPLLASPAPPGAPPAPARDGASPYRAAAASPPPPSIDEPEVLVAGLVATHGGRATIAVRLGGDFADYLIEAFVIAGADWAPVEARFRAQREVFVSLDVPAFVHPHDGAVGRVHVGARGDGARVRVTRDGAEVPLVLDGRALAPGAPLAGLVGGRAELSFLAGPGRWEAVIEDPSGARDSVAKDVEIPGKIRRIARAVRFLQPGESASRNQDAGVVGLRILPGLDKPFRAL
ncbi:MAG: TPR end-of-group domain-containing protein, partial [Byssovorax sp.]